jgi:hypothetical protein
VNTEHHRRAIPRRSPQVSGHGVLLSRAVLALFVVALVGCVSATPQKRAAQALDTIATSVDVGMKTVASLYKEGRVYDPSGVWRIVSPEDVLVTDATWLKLADLHEKYRRAGKAAALAIRAAGPNLANPDALLLDVQAAASEVMSLVTLLQQGRTK